MDVDSGKWMMSLEIGCQAWEAEVFESGRAVVESGKRLLNLKIMVEFGKGLSVFGN